MSVPLFKVFMPPSASSYVETALKSGYLSESENAAKFTELFSKYIENPNTILVNSCTSALHLAYILSGVDENSEVITTPLTAIASNLPIKYLNAKIVWADVEPTTGMISPQSVKEKITENTKAVLVLHKDGDLARLEEIIRTVRPLGIKVIVDAAHSLGASINKVPVGNLSDFTCFSFQAIKQLSTGDGGALSCLDEADYWQARKLKWFGVDKALKGNTNPWYNDVETIGYKYDLMEVNAALGISQMKHIQDLVDAAFDNGSFYSKELKNIEGLKLIKRRRQDRPSFWVYTFLAEERDSLIKKLGTKGIGSSQVHPRNDRWSIFEKSGTGELPGVDFFDAREISIPVGWWITKEIREYIVQIIREGW